MSVTRTRNMVYEVADAPEVSEHHGGGEDHGGGVGAVRAHDVLRDVTASGLEERVFLWKFRVRMRAQGV